RSAAAADLGRTADDRPHPLRLSDRGAVALGEPQLLGGRGRRAALDPVDSRRRSPSGRGKRSGEPSGMIVAFLLGGMLLLTALGLPLVFSILGASVATLLIFRPGLPLEITAQFFVSGIEHHPLLALAFFFLAGELMNAGGITKRIVDFANALVGHIRGG